MQFKFGFKSTLSLVLDRLIRQKEMFINQYRRHVLFCSFVYKYLDILDIYFV